MKQCSKCKEWKSRDKFYKRNNRPSGLQSHCKECMNTTHRKYTQTEHGKSIIHKINTSEKGRARMKKYDQGEKGKQKARQYRRTENYKQRHREANKTYRKNNPQVILAQSAIKYASDTGKIPKAKELDCIRCGKQAEHYHHHKGYEKKHYLDVIPVCTECHSAIHQKN